MVAFVQERGLDGVDFNWEYPGVSTPTTPSLVVKVLAVPPLLTRSYQSV